MTQVAIYGAAGRMGQRLLALAPEENLNIVAACVRQGHALLGQDISTVLGGEPLGVSFHESWEHKPDVVIDFSLPEGFRKILPRCVEEGVALVSGTTGLGDEDFDLLKQAAESIAVLHAPNMSLGVNLLFKIAGQVAATLQQAAGEDYDIEITESHHRHKKDAPSGTAIGLLQAICDATGKSIANDVVHGREGDSPREPGQIGVHALRMGSVIGEHAAYFANEQERLVLSHHAETRDVFARGALVAARWLAGQGNGQYTMQDVLGL